MVMLLVSVIAGTLVTAQAPAAAATGRLTGQVVESGTNTPVADARVTLGPARPAAGPIRTVDTTTDQNGRYVFENVAPGAYRLQVQKTGFANPLPQPGAPPPMPPPVDVVANETREAPALTLLRGGAISGQVFAPSGAPLAEARVTVLRRINQGRGGQFALVPAGGGASTNDLGEYRVFGLAPGEYYVQAGPRSESFRPGTQPPARSTLLAPTYFPGFIDQAGAQAVTVTSGQTTPNIAITLMQASAYQLSGVVVDENGAPAAGAAIMIRLDSATGPSTFTSPMFGIRTDGAGRFTVPNLLAGTYVVSAAVPVVINGSAASTSPASAALSGSSAAITGGLSGGTTPGGPVSRETVNGVTTEYRANPADQVRVAVNGDVSELRLVARRPRQ